MTNFKTRVLTAIVFVGLVTTLVLQHSRQRTLREQNEALRQQVAKLQADHDRLSNLAAPTAGAPALSSVRLRELLRLRNEVATLRRHQREREQAAVARRTAANPSGQPTPEAASPMNNPAPFQLQLVVDESVEDSELITNRVSGAAGESLRVQKTPLMDYTAIQAATATKDASTGALRIDVEFSEVGKELFAAVTRENLNQRLAIVLDGQLYAAPVIRGEISQGKAQITGNFTEEEATELAAKINAAINRP